MDSENVESMLFSELVSTLYKQISANGTRSLGVMDLQVLLRCGRSLVRFLLDHVRTRHFAVAAFNRSQPT